MSELISNVVEFSSSSCSSFSSSSKTEWKVSTTETVSTKEYRFEDAQSCELFLGQDYELLKGSYRRSGKLFVDSLFPPDSSSLGYLSELPCYMKGRVEWIRASDILKAQNVSLEPTFFAESASSFDYTQGQIGNCWFLAAVASLRSQKNLMVQVVPVEQSFMEYAGIFHFRFWRFGKWVDVVVDDYLPTFQKKLLSVSSKSNNIQFWVPLLEKAYAKLYGSYKLMNEAYPAEAFKDFLGGFQMSFILQTVVDRKEEEMFWALLNRAMSYRSMLCCSTATRGDLLINTVSDTGLLSCHSYIITKFAEVFVGTTKHLLVRVMNPWGERGWTGKWSDNSSVWNTISCEDRGNLIKVDDAEFWMDFQDFLKYFHVLTVGCDTPAFLTTDLTAQWKSLTFDGKWLAGVSAGGCLDKSTFWMNPQYHVTVGGVDQTELQKILITLMQKPSNLRETRMRAVGFTVFELPAGTPAGRLDASFFSVNRAPLWKFFGFDRDLTVELLLAAGEYMLMPSFMDVNESGEFLLSITSSADVTAVEYFEETVVFIPDTTCEPKPTMPDEKEDLLVIFQKYTGEGAEEVLDAKQIMLLLNEQVLEKFKVKFDLSICKSLFAMVDTERVGKLTFTQFTVVWTKFASFINIFYKLNVSKSGTLTFEELKEAVKIAGLDINENFLRLQYSYIQELHSVSVVDFLMFMMRMDSVSSGVFETVTLPTEKEDVLQIVQKYIDVVETDVVELNETQIMMLFNEYLVAGMSVKFDWSVVKSMLTMMDVRGGKVTFTQFLTLWTRFTTFRKIFYTLNVSKTATLTFEELLTALKAADIELDESLVRMEFSALQKKSSSVSLVDFLVFMLRIDSMASGGIVPVGLPTQKEEVFSIFKQYVVEGQEEVVDVKQMMLLLNEHVAVNVTEKFDWTVVNSMLSVVDTERVGKVTFTQFTVLWTKFANYMKFYQQHVAKSRTVTYETLQKVLKIAGIKYNENILKMQYIVLRSRSYVSMVEFFMFMLRMDTMSRGVYTLVSLPTDKEWVFALFKNYAVADLNGELTLDANKLMLLLNENVVNGLTIKFDYNVCQSMLAMVDVTRTWKLTFTQFTLLWGKLSEFMRIFYQLVLSKTVTLTFEDLQATLKVAGIELNDNILRMQYSQLQEHSTISLVDFIMFMLRLDTMSSGVFASVTLPTDRAVVFDMFEKYADLEDGTLMLNSKRMMLLLNERLVIGLSEKFDFSVCESLLSMVDTERVGKLSLAQFTVLWKKFALFMKIYFQSNVFKSGTLTFEEVQDALRVTGIEVSMTILKRQYQLLQADSYISLVEFLMFMLRIENMANAEVTLVSLPMEQEVVTGIYNKYAVLENGAMMMNGKRLMMLLNEQVVGGLTEKFDWSMCRIILSMVDVQQTGKITFTQFFSLWSKLSVYMKIYYESNVSKTGAITYEEVVNALKIAGIEVDEMMVKMQFTILQSDPFISLVDWIVFMTRMQSMAELTTFNRTVGSWEVVGGRNVTTVTEIRSGPMEISTEYRTHTLPMEMSTEYVTDGATTWTTEWTTVDGANAQL